ncbi:MAG: serine hydrolase [Planctomycetota bacterium]
MSDSDPSRLKGLTAFVRRAMAAWGVPGMAVAVVRGGRCVMVEGFGLRDVKRGLPVTPRTLFAIGSVTKAFTATALGILVDEGKLEWDTPVHKVLPGFRLRDRVATERTTPRDLLCHRTGLPRHDNAWYGLTLSRRQLFARLRHLPPSQDFRSCWQYQNMMFMVAGLVVEAVSGVTWEQFVRGRIFEPLGMTGANFSASDTQADEDHALPYRRKGKGAVRTAMDDLSSLGPAGGINAGAADMARWLAVNLNGGKAGRRRIVSARTLAEIHRPQAVVGEPVRWPEILHPCYGLGWRVLPYRGRVALTHGGLVNGFQACIGLLPHLRAGVVALSNLMGQAAPVAVVYHAFDRLLGVRPAPWIRRWREELARQKAEQAAARRKAVRQHRGKGGPPKALKTYTGRYRHPGYGTMAIRLADGGLEAHWAGIVHAVRHHRGDVFEMQRPLWGAKDLITFLANGAGRIDRLSIPFEQTVEAIVFRRVRTKGKG